MWTFEHSVTTQAKAASIWQLYSNLETWPEWDEFVHVELFGDFQTGTKGTLQPIGQDPLDYTIVEAVPLRSFTDITHMPAAGISISFAHTIAPHEQGCTVTHRITITGPNAEALGPRFGDEIAKRVPNTIERLVRLALQYEAKQMN